MSSLRTGLLVVLLCLACASGESTPAPEVPADAPATDAPAPDAPVGKAKGKRKAKAGFPVEPVCEAFCKRLADCGFGEDPLDCKLGCSEQLATKRDEVECTSLGTCEEFLACVKKANEG